MSAMGFGLADCSLGPGTGTRMRHYYGFSGMCLRLKESEPDRCFKVSSIFSRQAVREGGAAACLSEKGETSSCNAWPICEQTCSILASKDRR